MAIRWSMPGTGSTNEWGYRLESLGDGTMGHPTVAFWTELPAAEDVHVPLLREEERMAAVEAFAAQAGDRYRLASFDFARLHGLHAVTRFRERHDGLRDRALPFPTRDGLDHRLRVLSDGNGGAATAFMEFTSPTTGGPRTD